MWDIEVKQETLHVVVGLAAALPVFHVLLVRPGIISRVRVQVGMDSLHHEGKGGVFPVHSEGGAHGTIAKEGELRRVGQLFVSLKPRSDADLLTGIFALFQFCLVLVLLKKVHVAEAIERLAKSEVASQYVTQTVAFVEYAGPKSERLCVLAKQNTGIQRVGLVQQVLRQVDDARQLLTNPHPHQTQVKIHSHSNDTSPLCLCS